MHYVCLMHIVYPLTQFSHPAKQKVSLTVEILNKTCGVLFLGPINVAHLGLPTIFYFLSQIPGYIYSTSIYKYIIVISSITI